MSSPPVTSREAARTLGKQALRLLDIVLAFLVPISAIALIALIQAFPAGTFSGGVVLQMVLAVLGLMAVRSSVERFATLRDIEQSTGIIEEQTRQISEQGNLDLLVAARDAGIAALFPKAGSALYADCAKEISRSAGPLRLCGVALGAFCGEQILKDAIRAYGRENDILVLLLDPESEEAIRRAKIEEPLGRKTIAHIKGNRDWFTELKAENLRLELQLYATPPMLLLVLTDQFAYVEPYHFGRPNGLDGCIGGHVPIQKIRNQPELGPENPYAFYAAHFDYLWDETANFRSYLPISLSLAKPASYVVFKNDGSKDLQIDGWSIVGRNSREPYVFERFTWKAATQIVLSSDRESAPSEGTLFSADPTFMGDNTILTLKNAAGIEVGEFAVPREAQTLVIE